MSSPVNFSPGANLRRPHFGRSALCPRCSAGGGSPSYLDMWKKAMERERRSQLLRHITLPPSATEIEERERTQSLEKKTEVFNKILEVPTDERDRIQRMQVIDRASAAIAAARALIKESPAKAKQSKGGGLNLKSDGRSSTGTTETKSGNKSGKSLLIEDGTLPWIVKNANNEASPIRRHIELALCHLAQHEVNAKDMINEGALWELVRISRDCSREDIRSLAHRTLISSTIFQAELRRLRIVL